MISAEPLCNCLSVTLEDSWSWSGLSLGGWGAKSKCKTTLFAFSLIFYTWLSVTFSRYFVADISGIERTQQSLQRCIRFLLKKLIFQQSSSPVLGFPSLWKSLKLQGSDFCPGFISAPKASWCWNFSLFQAELEPVAGD